MNVCGLIKALKLEGMWKYRWRYTAEWRGTGAQSEHQCSRAYTTHNKWWAARTNNKHDNDIFGKCDATCLFQDNMLAVYMKIVWMHGLKKKKWVLVTETCSLSSHCAINSLSLSCLWSSENVHLLHWYWTHNSLCTKCKWFFFVWQATYDWHVSLN